MKTEDELNADILTITMTIEEKFPELVKYISEIPVDFTLSSTPEMNITILQDYYDSLDALLKKYSTTHNSLIE